MTAALLYISGFVASGLTNISGAFDVAVPQFSTANDSTANIIVFFTDGYPTTGITETNALVDHIDDLIDVTETNIFLFTFGIGPTTGEQLLTLLAAHNNGLSFFLGDDELYEAITSFYLTIRNPVLLNSQISFDPPVLVEVFPEPLPNLYKGVQMIVAGRYHQAGNVQITLSGDAFGQAVSYVYNLELVDSSISKYQFLQFLSKIWAIRKIEFLLIQYYSLDPNSPEAEALKEEIIWLSQAYGVISPFTSFSGGGTTSVEEDAGTSGSAVPVVFELLGCHPNPFNPETTIRIRLLDSVVGEIEIRIYNELGQVVRTLHLVINGKGEYAAVWDGSNSSGVPMPSGAYFYAIELQNVIKVGKMVLIR
jgi:Ca-activated chloride channel family protein